MFFENQRYGLKNSQKERHITFRETIKGIHLVKCLNSQLCETKEAGNNGMTSLKYQKKFLNLQIYKSVFYNVSFKNEGKIKKILWKCKSVQPLWKTVWRFLKKIKNRTTI